MVNYLAAVDAAFSALADPTRRAILARLSEAERTVGELARPLPMSLPAVSKHLRILEGAGLVTRRREGRTHHVRLVPSALAPAEEWIARQRASWTSRLDALDGYLRETRNAKDAATGSRRARGPGPGGPRGRRRSAPTRKAAR